MKQTLQRYWHIFWLFRSMRLQAMTEYRRDFVLWISINTVWTLFNFFFVGLLGSVSGSIAGWTVPELYLLMSLYTIFDSFTWSFFYPNMYEYTNAIFTGKLDTLLTKPIDTQFLLMTAETNYSSIPRFVIGVAACVWALTQLGIAPSLVTIALALVLFLLGFVTLYALWFCFSTLAFFVEKLDSINDIFPRMRRVMMMPRQVFTGIAGVVFTLVLPLTLFNSVPAEVLLERPDWRWVVYLVVVSLLISSTTRIFFKYSIRKYSSIGS